MKCRIQILLFVLISTTVGNSQIDTLEISHKLNSFKQPYDHKQFWETIHRQDQHFRGDKADESIDFLNIVKSSMYYNKFGYPTVELAGKKSSIINYVWIHSSIPKISELTFNLIFTGYLERTITEDELRSYYIRSMYKIKFEDDEYKTITIRDLLTKLNIPIIDRINIEELLIEYDKAQEFLNRDHNEIGLWVGETRFDTLYLNETPIINKIVSDPIRIFQDSNENYYLHLLYNDGSHYPQQVIRSKNNTFRVFEDSQSFYEILSNNKLRFVNMLGEENMYTPHINE